MTASRLALVADDQRLASQIQAAIKKAFGRDVPPCGLDAVRGQLTREDGSVLLLAAASPVESDRILRLVQEICLQKLPVSLTIVEAGTPGPGRGLAMLDSRVAGRLRWPEDAPRLVEWLRS